MKTGKALLTSLLCLALILTSLPIMTSCKAEAPYETPPQSAALSSAVLQYALGGVASGVLSWAGGKGCDLIFGLITGSEDKTEQELGDIKDKLGEMEKKLKDIGDTVNAIQDAVDDISKELKILQWDSAVGNAVGAFTTIEETFNKVQRITKDAKSNPSAYQNDVASLSKPDGEILNSTTGVYHAIGVIDSFMRGKAGQTSLLELRRQQVSKGLTYNNREKCYDAFELFFIGLVGMEVKGIELIINAYAGQGKPASAVSYLESFYEDKLVPQVELFSSCAEKLVWENKDMSWSEVILDPEPYIFPRADRLANGLLSGYYVEGDELKVGEDKGVITVRVRYPGDSVPMGVIQLQRTDNSAPSEIFTVQPELTNYKVLNYKLEAPPPGDYKLITTGYEKILHDYGEKVIKITDGNKYGYIGIYAWAPSSDYYEIISRNSGKPVDATGAGDKDNIQQWRYYGFDNQLWKFEHVGDGYYKIINKYSGKVLDVLSYSKEDSANIIQYTWHETDNEKWRLHLIEDGYLKIVNKNSGKVMDVKDGSTGDGANIQQYQWRGSGNQRWELKPEPKADEDTWFKIICKYDGDKRVLDVRGGGGWGAFVQVYPWNKSDAQKWQLQRKGNWYRLTPKHDKKTACADVQYASKDEGARIITWEYAGKDNQLWKFEPVGEGYYRIVSKNSKMCMTGWKNDGDIVIQWDYGKADPENTQKWKLVPTN